MITQEFIQHIADNINQMLRDNDAEIDQFIKETNLEQMKYISMNELRVWTAQEAVSKHIQFLDTLTEVIGIRRVLAERIGTRVDGCILLFLVCIKLGVPPEALIFAPLNIDNGQTAIMLYKLTDGRTVTVDWTNIKCVATHPNFKVVVPR